VIDVMVSVRRDSSLARAFFARALGHGFASVEVNTNRGSAYPRVISDLVPAATCCAAILE
jgi:transposase-like protein